MKHANLAVTIKSVDDRARTVRGIASTASLDRQGDIVEPLGARWRGASLPFLVAHDHRLVVGRVKFEKPTKDGIAFEAHLPEIREPGPLRDRVETAYQELKYGLINSVSIGFQPEPGKVEQLPSGGLRFLQFEIYELSMVAVGAQQDAEILEVRHNRTRRAVGARVVKLDHRPARAEAHRIRITKEEMLIAKWLVEGDKRAASRKRLGIPCRPVKITAADRVEGSLAAARAKAKKPFRIVKIHRTR